jgi:hypothetical protein
LLIAFTFFDDEWCVKKWEGSEEWWWVMWELGWWKDLTYHEKVNSQEEATTSWRNKLLNRVMVLTIVRVGNFMSMVTRREWWKVSKRNLNMLLKLMNRSRKEKKVGQCCCEA